MVSRTEVIIGEMAGSGGERTVCNGFERVRVEHILFP